MRISFDGELIGISGREDRLSFSVLKEKKVLFEVELKEFAAKKILKDLNLENELDLAGKTVQLIISD